VVTLDETKSVERLLFLPHAGLAISIVIISRNYKSEEHLGEQGLL
jgi:hypothetical protein